MVLWGTGGGSNAAPHGSDKFDNKYRGWSRSRIRRGLDKLKRQGPVEKDSPLCEEILYLSHRLRLEIKNRPQPHKPVSERDFGVGFWPSCRNFFADVAGATPSFIISECACYFSGMLSLPDVRWKFLFSIPDWFVSLPAPSVSFDQSAPSYTEIVSIISKARGTLQPVPLTKSASLRLKNVKPLDNPAQYHCKLLA